MNISLDWLSFTVPSNFWGGAGSPVPALRAIGFDVDDYQPRVNRDGTPRGFLGYRRSATFSRGAIAGWGGNEGTLFVSVPASSIAYLAHHGRFASILRHVYRCGFAVRRLDVALDDREGLLTLERLLSARIRSRLRTRRLIRDLKGSGWTLYVGSRSGEVYIRFYNKAAEQGLSEAWVRWETEFKGKRAVQAFGLLMEDGVMALAQFVHGFVDFVDTEESNITRAKLAAWWALFLRGLGRVRLTLPTKWRDVTDVLRWVASQVSASLVVLERTFGRGVLDSLLAEGEERLKRYHYQMIAEALS